VLARDFTITIAGKLWSEDCSLNRRIERMENVEMNNRGTALLTFVTGLAAGIALTILFAPRSGAATRRLIGRKVEAGQDWMTDKASAAQDYVTDKATAAQDYVRDRGEELRGRVKEVAEVIGRR
jgi:gas vesicle protein